MRSELDRNQIMFESAVTAVIPALAAEIDSGPWLMKLPNPGGGGEQA
jgi:hypothetical protein